MAKKTATASEPKTPGILPVPEPVVRHHGTTLHPMLSEWSSLGRVPPVLLLTGTSGCGKRSMAYWLSQWILCDRNGFGSNSLVDEAAESGMDNLFGAPAASAETPAAQQTNARHANAQGPCGECPSCMRALHSSWVDFTEVLPEDSEEGANSSGALKVEQFREIKRKLGFGAHQGAYRIVLIPNADRMTVQAANSLLKLLEEPPPGWVFFLTASDPTLVLPTILSRCQQLRLKPFAQDALVELLGLAGVAPARAEVCAGLAQGSWTRALAWAQDETWENRKTLFAFIKEPASALTQLVDWASSEPRAFDLLVDSLEQLTGELVQWSVSPQASSPEAYVWRNSDGRAALVHHASAMTRRLGTPRAREFWVDRAERLAQARSQALAPLNRKILVQDLLIAWI